MCSMLHSCIDRSTLFSKPTQKRPPVWVVALLLGRVTDLDAASKSPLGRNTINIAPIISRGRLYLAIITKCSLGKDVSIIVESDLFPICYSTTVINDIKSTTTTKYIRGNMCHAQRNYD